GVAGLHLLALDRAGIGRRRAHAPAHDLLAAGIDTHLAALAVLAALLEALEGAVGIAGRRRPRAGAHHLLAGGVDADLAGALLALLGPALDRLARSGRRVAAGAGLVGIAGGGVLGGRVAGPGRRVGAAAGAACGQRSAE